MEILPNLHWIRGTGSNIYLWRDRSGAFLVDTGMPWDSGRVFDYLDGLGLQPEDLSAILITHADYDHAGGAARIQERTGAPVYAGAATASLLAQGRSPKHMPRPIQLVIDSLLKYRPVPGDQIVIVSDGETLPGLERWQSLATPGHTPDHFAFFSVVYGVVFAGDVMDNRDGRLRLKPDYITSDTSAVRTSALRLLRLTPAVVASGHGRPRTHSAEGLMGLLHYLRAQNSA